MVSIKNWLVNKVKHSKGLYSFYYVCGNAVLGILKLIVKPDNNLILFVSFGGKKFDDSPRAIYEMMLQDSRFRNKKLVWAFLKPEETPVPGDQKIKIDTLRYYTIALKARVWITNSSIERGLTFRGKHTFFLNTWHGSAIKKMGSDIASTNEGFKKKGNSQVDIMAAQGEFDVDVFSKVFGIPRERFRIIGLPRNDRLAHHDEAYRTRLRNELNLPLEKKVILYAPTYREYEFDCRGVYQTIPLNIEELKKSLNDDYMLLFRAHHAVARHLAIKDDDCVRDVSFYPKLEDLMIASDLLVSDYSSIFFDYSIMAKPMLCFTYDYDKYVSERGVYFDIREKLPSAATQNGLVELLNSLDFESATSRTVAFRDSYVTTYGHATEMTLDIIAKELNI